MTDKFAKGEKIINTKRIKNKARTAYIWITQWFSLIAEDSMHMLLGMSCWELFPPSFYRTHTEEEIREATEAAKKELDELLNMLEMKGKEDE